MIRDRGRSWLNIVRSNINKIQKRESTGDVDEEIFSSTYGFKKCAANNIKEKIVLVPFVHPEDETTNDSLKFKPLTQKRRNIQGVPEFRAESKR